MCRPVRFKYIELDVIDSMDPDCGTRLRLLRSPIGSLPPTNSSLAVRSPEATAKRWETSQEPAIVIRLRCGQTALAVEVSDR